MKKIEIFFASILVLVLFLKAFNVAYCNEIAVLSLLSLSPIYMIGGYFLFKETRHYTAISILAGLCFTTAFHGILFKIQSWPYANELLILPIIGMLVLLLFVWYFFIKNTSTEPINTHNTNFLLDVEDSSIQTTTKLYCQNMAIRFCLILPLIIGLLLCENNTIFNFCHRDDPELVRLHTLFTNNPNDDDARESYIEYKRVH
jgi:hypothetical protein